MNRDAFTLFFSRPLQRASETTDGHDDWANLDRSKVKQVMFPFGMAALGLSSPGDHRAEQETLQGFAQRGLRLVLRMNPQDCERTDPNTARQVIQQSGARAVIVHNEPDWDPVRFGMKWGDDWGNNNPNAARAYAEMLRRWGQALSNLGVQLVAGALAMREWSGNTPALPGQIAWREWLAPVINDLYQGWGAHYYNYDWPVGNPTPWASVELDVNIGRFASWLHWWSSLSHRPIWIDECNLDRGPNTPISQEFRMRACLGKAAFCERHERGSRVAMFAPFVSNGFGNAYPPGMVMTDPVCYDWVRTFMEGR
ncbi:MAG TPA: hypothetical protein VJ183_01400 [Chloroflexia bacterium]|nr:hypothetical protein [Chloroflexia bacterium]